MHWCRPSRVASPVPAPYLSNWSEAAKMVGHIMRSKVNSAKLCRTTPFSQAARHVAWWCLTCGPSVPMAPLRHTPRHQGALLLPLEVAREMLANGALVWPSFSPTPGLPTSLGTLALLLPLSSGHPASGAASPWEHSHCQGMQVQKGGNSCEKGCPRPQVPRWVVPWEARRKIARLAGHPPRNMTAPMISGLDSNMGWIFHVGLLRAVTNRFRAISLP